MPRKYIPKVCASCGTPYLAQRHSSRFCSQACFAINRQRTPIADRFWPKVQRVDGAGCWFWRGSTDRNGRGRILPDMNIAYTPGVKPTPALAYRVAWELTYGPIPIGMHVCHHCDNPNCVRPDHLFVGNALDNVADMIAKGRANHSGPAKLTRADAQSIRLRHASGETRKGLANAYGVSRSQIGRIVLGANWKDGD